RLRLCDGLNPAGKLLAVADPLSVSLEFRSISPLGVVEDLTDTAERTVVRATNGDESVGTAKRLIGRAHTVSGAKPFGNTAPGEILRGLPDRKADAGIEQRRVHVLPTAGRVAMLERRKDADDGEERGAKIGQRNSRLYRRAAGLARDRHDPRHALGYDAEPASILHGPRVPVARK